MLTRFEDAEVDHPVLIADGIRAEFFGKGMFRNGNEVSFLLAGWHNKPGYPQNVVLSKFTGESKYRGCEFWAPHMWGERSTTVFHTVHRRYLAGWAYEFEKPEDPFLLLFRSRMHENLSTKLRESWAALHLMRRS